MTGKETGGEAGLSRSPSQDRHVVSHLILVPLAIYVVWLIETFLLEGNQHTFSRFSPANLLTYTVIVCIITGIIIPILIVRKSFRSGDVNMFQIGFRSTRRTLAACACTALAGYMAVLLAGPPGPDRFAFAVSFLLLLPTAIASVMVCWVLVGTHLQTSARSGGSLVTIPAGVVVTAILFGLTALVHSIGSQPRSLVPLFIGAGFLAALFYFAVRDVYSASIAVALMSTFIAMSGIDPKYLVMPFPWVVLSASLAIAALIGVHLYLNRHFTTIQVPV